MARRVGTGTTFGLVMTGGGVRAAYQAGVLKRIGAIPAVKKRGNPFPIVGGASAGAINGSAVAVGADEFDVVTKRIGQLWSNITPSDVFRCDIVSQAHMSISWILELSFGGFIGGGNATYLLDATPLRAFLAKHIDCDRIQNNIRLGKLYALAISATNYGQELPFHLGEKGPPHVEHEPARALATKLTVDHICASAAIALVFPPITLATPDGTALFGDGRVRLISLSAR